MASPTVFIKNISFSYQGVLLFKELNLTLKPGRFTCLLGQSGIGKTTLLRIIANLITPHNQEELSGEISTNNHSPAQQQIAYLAQHDLLLPWFNALDNALLGARLRGELSTHLIQYAKELFAKVGLEKSAKKYPQQLSGGMRQRVALVRTLLEEKPIVLMDEPFAFLDTLTRLQLQTLAVELLKNRTVLFVTHDPLEAVRLADSIYILSGQPATLHLMAELKSTTPRDPADPEVMHYQALLFKTITEKNA